MPGVLITTKGKEQRMRRRREMPNEDDDGMEMMEKVGEFVEC
jgi:hypothetical protein